jgi:hypothetical protein
MKMLNPAVNIRLVAPKRRNVAIHSQAWNAFSERVFRRAEAPITARQITDALIADKAPKATRKQARPYRRAFSPPRDGSFVIDDGAPA